MIVKEEKIVSIYRVGITGAYDVINSNNHFGSSESTTPNGDKIIYESRGTSADLGLLDRDRRFEIYVSDRPTKYHQIVVGCQRYTRPEIEYIIGKLKSPDPTTPKVRACKASPRGTAYEILEESENYYILSNGKAVLKNKTGISFVEIDKDSDKKQELIKIKQRSTGDFDVSRSGYNWRIKDKDQFIKAMNNFIALSELRVQ